MSTLCLCDLGDNDLRVLASLSTRPNPAPVAAPGLRLQPPISWLRSTAPAGNSAPAGREPRS